jgi:3-hydroxyacyl-CoA dehydrogenase
MRWGFGMKQGPFELWQEAGWLQVAQWIQEDIDAGKALSTAPLPSLGVQGPGGRGRRRAHARGIVEPDDGQVRAATQAAGA